MCCHVVDVNVADAVKVFNTLTQDFTHKQTNTHTQAQVYCKLIQSLSQHGVLSGVFIDFTGPAVSSRDHVTCDT